VWPQLMIVNLAGKPGCFAVCGEIDIYTVPDLQDALRRAVQAAAPGAAIMVDLSAVGFIDVRGLAALVEADAYACVRGVGLVFAAVPDSITRLLMITGMSLRGSAPS
jgi:anti-anti-sigma factor